MLLCLIYTNLLLHKRQHHKTKLRARRRQMPQHVAVPDAAVGGGECALGEPERVEQHVAACEQRHRPSRQRIVVVQRGVLAVH